MTDDSTHNPETDTFQYMRLIIESLNKMNRLDLAINTIEQRLPVELFKVVDKSNNEVAQRHPSILRAYASRKASKSKNLVESDELLDDLLYTLYARFEAIAESHRAVHDVVAGIVRREGLRDSSSAALTRGFKELWKLYQSEVFGSNIIRDPD
jgi:exocyst complex component 4